jgi:hypothetical protein
MVDHHVHASLMYSIHHSLPVLDGAIVGVEEGKIYRLIMVRDGRLNFRKDCMLTEYESTPQGRFMNGEPAM